MNFNSLSYSSFESVVLPCNTDEEERSRACLVFLRWLLTAVIDDLVLFCFDSVKSSGTSSLGPTPTTTQLLSVGICSAKGGHSSH